MNRAEIQEMSRHLNARLLSGTKIEWTHPPGHPPGQTWNPWHGCNEIAPECGLDAPRNPQPVGGGCYAARGDSRNLHPNHRGTAVKGKWTGLITYATQTHLESPFHYPDGTFIFTCSQSDFWHEGVDLEKLDEALDVIDFTPWNTYLILTKRPALAIRRLAALKRRWPKNAWAGATIGHPKSLSLLKSLLRIDASIRFLSCEPLLAPLVPGLDLTGIAWVIGGGESGPKARPCLVDWRFSDPGLTRQALCRA
jgi:protein gp37